MVLNLKELFENKHNTPIDTSTQTISASITNADDIQDGETYHNYGKRICAITSASNISLQTFLQRVYNIRRASQVNNPQLQDAYRKQLQNKIQDAQDNISNLESEKRQHQTAIQNNNNEIDNRKNEITQIKARGEKINREKKLQMIIGIIILVPLTIYLFLFYSSTCYSAFFRNPGQITGLATAMFDPTALGKALNSLPEFFLLICMPVIFLGLGYILHFYAKEKKYLQAAAIVFVTFCFDCILAYLIAKNMYEYQQMISPVVTVKTYNVGMAIADANVWGVIFCGFVSYIIWGLVFDLAMTAYNKLDLNQAELESLQSQIQQLKDDNDKKQNKINDINREISNAQSNIRNYQSQLANKVSIDLNDIRTEMTNFHTGWIAQMAFLGMSQTTQADARNIGQQVINQMLNSSTNINNQVTN